MVPLRRTARLLDRLPPVRGRYAENVALAAITWFRVGGVAEVMFRPADRADLRDFLRAKPADVAVTVMGVGSNLLVRDGGVPGVLVRLGRDFAGLAMAGTEVQVGAAVLDANVAEASVTAGLGGIEFLSGVPGTIGGALRMNAGAYGREMADVVRRAEAMAPDGSLHALEAAALGFRYRACRVPPDWIFLAATLHGEPAAPDAIRARIAEIKTARHESQPVRSRTGGSTFRNPPGARAWEVIDRAGCRGLRRGAAMVSEQHCNFLINTGGASAADLEALGEEVRRRVLQTTGVALEWEIVRIGQVAVLAAERAT
ncbi:MAG: UDP-N-acetylmuramate dehydrogenase [Alphaproteobacteria bacterium]|nr:UDP-N-acetylmuramate dehydrogenase [Alphaproteobacteria bacterium]